MTLAANGSPDGLVRPLFLRLRCDTLSEIFHWSLCWAECVFTVRDSNDASSSKAISMISDTQSMWHFRSPSGRGELSHPFCLCFYPWSCLQLRLAPLPPFMYHDSPFMIHAFNALHPVTRSQTNVFIGPHVVHMTLLQQSERNGIMPTSF